MPTLDDIISMPAKAMAYMPKRPDEKSLEAMGLMGQIHQAIDPVQSLGGYGNVAAMAIPGGAAGRPTLAQFKALQQAGKMQQSMPFKEALRVAEKRGFVEVPPSAMTGKTMTKLQALERKGFVPFDNPINKTELVLARPDVAKAYTAAMKSKNASKIGKIYGYSDADIAHFYNKRRGGMSDVAYSEWVKDVAGP